MKISRLVVQEIAHRFVNFVLAVIGVSIAVTWKGLPLRLEKFLVGRCRGCFGRVSVDLRNSERASKDWIGCWVP